MDIFKRITIYLWHLKCILKGYIWTPTEVIQFIWRAHDLGLNPNFARYKFLGNLISLCLSFLFCGIETVILSMSWGCYEDRVTQHQSFSTGHMALLPGSSVISAVVTEKCGHVVPWMRLYSTQVSRWRKLVRYPLTKSRIWMKALLNSWSTQTRLMESYLRLPQEGSKKRRITSRSLREKRALWLKYHTHQRSWLSHSFTVRSGTIPIESWVSIFKSALYRGQVRLHLKSVMVIWSL